MTYQRFEDLPVWQEAAKLYEQTDDFLESAPPRMRPSFRDQLERAVLSVSNNVAEGFERGTTNELLQFIYIARGSAGKGAFDAHAPVEARLGRSFEISNLKFEIHGRELFPPIARLGRLAAVFRNQRPAPFERSDAGSGRSEASRGRTSKKAPREPAAESSPPPHGI